MTTTFKNARLIDPASNLDEHGSLIVDAGMIAAVGPDLKVPESGTIIDCKGKILAPGLIDMRAHSVDADSAAAGGITTVILQPDQNTLIDTDAAVERIRARARATGSVRVYPMGAATKGLAGLEMAEIGQMKASGAVAFTDCRHPVSDANMLRRIMEYAGHFGALVVQFAEETSLAKDGLAHPGITATRLGLPSIPSMAEVIQIERDCRLAELTDARLHIALVSSRQGLDAIRAAKARGVKVSAGTSPAYLHFNDNALEGYRTFAKLSPPLRSEDDRVALIDGLADGSIDVLVSDHDPRSEDQKRLPLAQAASGAVGFETLLMGALAHVQAGKLDMIRALDSLTAKPASLLGLDTGTLIPGRPADLLLFDPDRPSFLDRKVLRSSAKNTPFDTLPMQGKVIATYIGGRAIFTASAQTST